MRLSGLAVTNHSRLENVNMEIRRHLILVGANDVGKSSLLRCLDMVLGATTAQLYNRITREDFRDPQVELIVEVTLTDLSDDEIAYFPDEINVQPITNTTSLKIRMEASLENEETLQIRRFAPDARNSRQITRDQFSALGWKMIGATQGGLRDFRDDRNSVLEDILSAVDFGDERAAFKSTSDLFQTNLNGSVVLLDLRKQLATQLSKAIPTRVEPEDLSFVSGSVVDDDILADVRLQLTRNGMSRSMSEQSDGARALFAIALYDLVSSAANIVAVDEPEIHLHPASQRSLARLLKSGGNQKILATHSPDIVGSFPPDDIAVVRKGGQIVQPEAGFLDKYTKLSAQWWIKDKLEPLTSARVILVEGASDRILLYRVAELLDFDLDRLGASVISLDGAGDLKTARAIFGPTGFDVPMSVLIDDDQVVANTEKVYEITRESFQEHGIVVSSPDLEGEYVAAIGASTVWQWLSDSTEFGENKLKTCTPTGPDGKYTATDVAAFCRKSGDTKIRSALVIAANLNAAQAARVASLVNLIKTATKD